MALFTKKIWKNRLSEYPNRRKLTKENGTTELVTVARSEGTVSQEGDAFSADNMNNLEERISKAIGTGSIPAGLGTDIISALNALNTGLPYISNFKTQKILKEVISYTADKTCMVYVQCVSNNKLYGTIIVRVGEYYVFQWQNATAQENLTYGILIALQEGDTINTYGTGIKTSNFYVHD